MARKKENSLAFRDPAPNTDGNLACRRPLCRLNSTNQVSQRQPLACELTVDAAGARNARESTSAFNTARICLLCNTARGPGVRHEEILGSPAAWKGWLGQQGVLSGKEKPSGLRAFHRLWALGIFPGTHSPDHRSAPTLSGPDPSGRLDPELWQSASCPGSSVWWGRETGSKSVSAHQEIWGGGWWMMAGEIYGALSQGQAQS